jgi:broad specificity phosphatase PhoE
MLRDPLAPQLWVLLRHGESTWNQRRLIQGQDDRAVLTARGRQQALAAARSLRHENLDAIVSSDLARARATASIIGDELGLAVTTSPALRERSFGNLEGRTLDALTAAESGIDGGVVRDATAHPPGGESLQDVAARAACFVWETLEARGRERLLLVTHGGVIRALRALDAGAAMTGLAWDEVANASLWRVGPFRPPGDGRR